MIRSKTKATLLFFVFALAAQPAQAADFEYELRGAGGPEERLEGVIPEKTAGGLVLLSFTLLSTSPAVDDASRLYVRFLSPMNTEAYLSVQEIHREKSYRLDATRSQWPANDNEFSWPTSEVIHPLEVKVSNLGVVVSERRYGGSGLVFPASISLGKPPSNTNSYQVTIRSKHTCTPLTWNLNRVVDKGEIPEQREAIDHVPSERPRSIVFDLTGGMGGWYRFRLKCDRQGHGSGSGVGSVLKRTYTFFHRQR